MREFTVTDFQRNVDACVGVEDSIVFDDTTLDVEFAELGLDSLAVYEIMTRLEEDLGFPIPDEDLDDLKTVGGVLTYVRRRLAEV
ncbi:acyl carrier protein [Streptomyces olivoverticillatus]|uniref:Acyl carrier protein n=1 Tax=Streptomyces olivoverticillatus TaxID=66427 RepID=A0A7W7LRR2_9ACTN|nr:acyl carrier protein [Streptomyces olivoverticillatus]MBB4895210.1 acyl carrier protein [Streptomyces olivoverticillatus]